MTRPRLIARADSCLSLAKRRAHVSVIAAADPDRRSPSHRPLATRALPRPCHSGCVSAFTRKTKKRTRSLVLLAVDHAAIGIPVVQRRTPCAKRDRDRGRARIACYSLKRRDNLAGSERRPAYAADRAVPSEKNEFLRRAKRRTERKPAGSILTAYICTYVRACVRIALPQDRRRGR